MAFTNEKSDDNGVGRTGRIWMPRKGCGKEYDEANMTDMIAETKIA